ncbi:MAG TPA: DUF4340 domain-containing protein [Candidatus Binataceae bacterium]|nr:DUF4340 domain-containing protein [Candidatus Binataceae bacterium]
MKIRNTIIVMVLLAIVGGYAFIIGRYSKPVENQPLLGIKADDIKSIDLRSADRDLMIERDKGGDWRIVKPKQAAADRFETRNLAQAIADCKVETTVEDNPKDLEPFGLKNPQTTVTVTTFDGKPHPGIEVGKTTPVGFHAYIKTTDKPAVMLTSSGFPPGMNKTFNDLRSREILSFNPADVNKLILANDNGQTTEFDRDGDKFKMVKPVDYPTDTLRVREILSTLSNTRVQDFVSDAPTNVAQYGLEKPHFTATVVLDNGQEQSLMFGFRPSSGSAGVYARRGESVPVYTVGNYELENVDRPLLEFHDTKIINLDPSTVTNVSVTNGSGKFTLERSAPGKWAVIQNGQSHEGNAVAIDQFLVRLRGLRGMSVAADPMTDPAAYALDKPAIEIALKGKGGKSLGEIMASKRPLKPGEPPTHTGEDVLYYAESSIGKAVFDLGPDNFRTMNNPPILYMKIVATPSPAASPVASPAAK